MLTPHFLIINYVKHWPGVEPGRLCSESFTTMKADHVFNATHCFLCPSKFLVDGKSFSLSPLPASFYLPHSWEGRC